jgi:hypothetical protein
MMKEALKELRKDFKECLDGIDFKQYDPYSKKFMTAGFIGQMWFLVKMLCEDDEVEEELDGAKKYMARYEDTGDTSFREMAKDELKHAGILIKKKYEWAEGEKKVHLEEQENERQMLLKQLEEA